MASRSLGQLTLDLIARTGGFEKGMDAAARAAEKRMKDIRKQVAKVRGQVNSIGKAFLGASATAGVALGGIVALSAKAGKELKSMADVANASASEFQATAIGVKTVGIETDKWSDILKDTNDRIGDFVESGGGPMADFFENIAPKVGVTAEQFRKLSGPQALQLYVKSLEDANLNQQQMTFYMEAIAGDSAKLLPLLKNNAAALKEQADRARDLGLVLSDMQVESLSQLSDDIDRLGQLFTSFAQQYAAELAPVLSGLVNYLEQSIIQAGGFGKVAADAADWTVEAFGNVMDVIRGLHVVVKGLELAFQGAALLVTTSWSEVGNTIHTLISGAAGAIDDLIKKANELPGVEIGLIGDIDKPEFLKILNDASAAMLEKVNQTKKELHELAMEPMPSETIKGFAERAKKEIEQAVKAAQDAKKTMAGANGGGAGLAGDDKVLDALIDEAWAYTEARAKAVEADKKLAEEREKNLAGVRASLMTEEQLIQASYEKRRQIVLDNTIAGSEQRTNLELKLAEQRNAQLRRLEMERTSAVVSASANLFGELSELAKNFSNKQSSTYKTLFAISKGFAVADAGLRLSMAVAQAMADPTALTLPQKLANYAAVASTMGNLVNTISGLEYSGAYDKGGTIPGGSFGIVGERGPEIVQGPAHVTSRADTAKMMGGGNVTVNLVEDASRAGRVDKTPRPGGMDITAFVSNIRDDGPAARALEQTYGLRRVGS